MENIKNTVKGAAEVYFSDTPLWAKIVRFAGITTGAFGGAVAVTVATGGVALPAILVTASPYMVLFGNFTALFVQKYTRKKSEK
jgi:hypothetical protein